MKRRYFVVSLPRTGTQTMCKMATKIGFEAVHCPYNKAFPRGDFFADTPCYVPSIFRQLVLDERNLFIYVERDFRLLVESWSRVNLFKMYNEKYQYKDNFNHRLSLDRECYREVFNGATKITETTAVPFFVRHKNKVYDIIPKHRLLSYKFRDGWKPFCDFLQAECPENATVPHVDKMKGGEIKFQ